MTTFPRKDLLQLVQVAAGVLPNNTLKDALKGLLLRCDNIGKMTIFTNDMDGCCLTATIDGNGSRAFDALPDARRIVAILSEMIDEEVTLSKELDVLYIRGGFSEFDLKDCANPEVYPANVDSEAETYTVSADVLMPAIRRIAPFDADQSARYALTGVKWELGDGELYLVATDGKRLAVDVIPVPGCKPQSWDSVVPAKAIKLLSQAIKMNGEVTFSIDKNRFVASVGNVTISSRLLEGRYPTWREVLLKKVDYSLPMQAGALLRVTRQAAVMMTEETRGITYTFGNNTLQAHAQDAVAGKATIKQPIAYDGPEFSTVLQGDYVKEALSVWPADAEFNLRTVKKNTVIEFDFGNGARHVIVPLTTREAA